MGYGLPNSRNARVMPLVGESLRVPWSGYWWPMRKAELALGWDDGQGRRRWTEPEVRTFDSYLSSSSRSSSRALEHYLASEGRCLSPLMKFDLWVRRWLELSEGRTSITPATSTHATRWELDHHTIGDDTDHPHHASSHFAGKCLGWALSTFDWDEPVRDLELLGITFRPADIKGLLASIYNGAQFFVPEASFVGHSYRDIEGHNLREYYEDVHPPDFIRALASTVGRGLLLEGDLCTGHEVWNHPIYRYELSHGSIRRGRVEVEATIHYADDDVDIDGVFSLDPERPDLRSRTLNFELDLPPHAASIVAATGGRWLGESIHTHPDTLILGLEPGWRQKIYQYRRTQMIQEVNFPLIKRLRVGTRRVPMIDLLLSDYFAQQTGG